MPGQVELAKKLKAHLDEVGALSSTEVKQFLVDEGSEPSKVGLVMGYGKANQRKWWKIEDDTYWPDSGSPDLPSGSSVPGSNDTSDPDAIETPQDRFAGLLLGLGIPQKSIGPISLYLGQNFDLDDPAQVWQGLKECQELTPSNRKRVWRTWLSFTGTEPPQELINTVEKQTPPGISTLTPDGPKSRTFIAVGGEVIPTDETDETGMTFAQALQIANTQGRNGSDSKEDGVMVAMVQAQAQTTAAMLTAVASGNKDDGSSMAVMIQMMENQRESDRVRADSERERHKQEIEMERLRLEGDRKVEGLRMEQQMERMTEMVQTIQAPTNPLGQLDQIVPGLGTKLMDRLFAPATPAAQISMPGVTGPDGNPVPIDIETWKSMKSIEQKDEMIKQLRQNFPAFVQAAMQIAKASGVGNSNQEEPVKPDAEGIPQPDEGMVGFQCMNCETILQAPKDFEQVQCPLCNAIMDRTGKWLNVNDFFPDKVEEEAPIDPNTGFVDSAPDQPDIETHEPEQEVILPEPVIMTQPAPEIIEGTAIDTTEPEIDPEPDPETEKEPIQV